MKGKEELSVICIKVVVNRERGDERAQSIVYMMQSRRRKIDPWEHHRRRVYRGERFFSHLTLKQRDDK